MQSDPCHHRLHTVFSLVPILINVERQSMQLLASPEGGGGGDCAFKLFFNYLFHWARLRPKQNHCLFQVTQPTLSLGAINMLI